MYILELEYPGTWLDYEDQDWAWQVRNLIQQIESQFTEATLSLGLFDQERSRPDRIHFREQWDADAELRRDITNKFIEENGIGIYYQQHQLFTEYIDVELRRQKWKNGELPREYQHGFIFIYAKSFLYSIDSIGKFLKVLTKTDGVPPEIEVFSSKFFAQFPTIHHVRNSSQHIEDRSRGLGRNEKPLELKPIQNNSIHSEGGALVLNSLNGNNFGNTMADGHYGEVEVSIESLLFIRDCIQEVINAIKWKGPKEYYPR